MATSRVISPADLSLESQDGNEPESFRQAKSRAVSAFERNYIRLLLAKCDGNISQAARSAGKNRRAFWELMRKHGIDSNVYRS